MDLAIISIVLGIIYLIVMIVWNHKQDKRAKISLNLPILERLYQRYYDLFKDLINRMEIKKPEKREDFLIYRFKISKLNAEGYLEPREQKTQIYRLDNMQSEIASVAGYKKIKTHDKWQKAKIKIIFNPMYLTIPHFFNFKNPEEIKTYLLNEFKIIAKEMGVKLRD
ncbi:MAG: hypothetical protein ACFFDH_03310 [Promethearchaeota archaeon]